MDSKFLNSFRKTFNSLFFHRSLSNCIHPKHSTVSVPLCLDEIFFNALKRLLSFFQYHRSILNMDSLLPTYVQTRPMAYNRRHLSSDEDSAAIAAPKKLQEEREERTLIENIICFLCCLSKSTTPPRHTSRIFLTLLQMDEAIFSRIDTQ